VNWVRVVKTAELGRRGLLGDLLRHDLDIFWLLIELQFCPQCESWGGWKVPMSVLLRTLKVWVSMNKPRDLGARDALGDLLRHDLDISRSKSEMQFCTQC